jgi:hypothetical protein
MSEKCEMYDRDCINCGECELCDLDENERCVSCGRCIEESGEFRIVKYNDIFNEEEN